MRFIIIGLGLLAGCEADGSGTNPGTPPTSPTTPLPAVDLAAAVDIVTGPAALEVGCSDVYGASYGQNGTAVLGIGISGDRLAAAHGGGKPVEEVFQLPHDDVDVRLTWGEHVDEWTTCDDVVEREPVIVGEAVPISGTLTLTLEPSDEIDYATGDATFRLEDVVLEEEGAANQESLESFELGPLFVGWLPG